jgi:hypothetical protein
MRCSRCCGEYHEVFFRGAGLSNAYSRHKYLRPVCIGCEQTRRDKHKQSNRARAKVVDAIRRHAERYIRDGLAKTRADFEEDFGWNISQMLHDLEHAYVNGCPYCNERFSEMGHGLSDITIDICDTRQPPYYGVNTRWVCATCNREKSRTPPELWGAKLICWKRWNEQQGNLERNPLSGLPLFDCLNA